MTTEDDRCPTKIKKMISTDHHVVKELYYVAYWAMKKSQAYWAKQRKQLLMGKRMILFYLQK